MVEAASSTSTSTVTSDTVFTQLTVPLLSGLSSQFLGTQIPEDRASLITLLKLNHILCATSAPINSDGITSEMKEAWAKYRPLVIVGPSGAGKGTLIAKLTQKYPEKFGFSVSYTTRAARVGEVDGVHYFFVNHEKFQEKIDNDDFIEYCKVHTNFYGTEKAQIRTFSDRQIIPILDIDIQGAKKVFAAFPETNFIFICPPSVAELKRRLEGRGTDSAA